MSGFCEHSILDFLRWPNQRIALRGVRSRASGALGVDNVRFTTQERCSPRWITFPGFKFRDFNDADRIRSVRFGFAYLRIKIYIYLVTPGHTQTFYGYLRRN